eukprot:Anaeramoba_flamelloidesa571822_19.p1 GENE.a571822_19~~a571822_19.p1  ORF type:complete len:210 (+),score=30.22 a571822_19:43-672(+)
MADKKYYHIASLEKGIRILELLVDHEELSVSETARLMDTNRAGSHRFISTLKDLGYVEKNERNNYQPTLKIMTLAAKVLARFEVRQVARPFMQELSNFSKETINLGVFKDQQIIHIEKIDSLEVLRIDSVLGEKAPAYSTGLGKAILAFLPEDELANYLDTVELKSLTANTIADREKLIAELGRIREKGYAVDDEELTPGLFLHRCPGF